MRWCKGYWSARISLEADRKIIDRRLVDGIQFHLALHGFCKLCGMDTAILECRLEQERAILQGQTLYQVFLDLTKAYDTLDQPCTLDLLKGYGIRSNIWRIL